MHRLVGRAPGIIPARAGSSVHMTPRRSCTWDHPRACGEQPSVPISSCPQLGSSPRVRGAGVRVAQRRHRYRIIPARAGSRGMALWPAVLSRDHPRACGEQEISRRLGRSRAGSSPRVRGAAGCGGGDRLRPRIIPARAGSSVAHDRVLRDDTDHPRACGEQGTITLDLTKDQGSSPRVRGAA